MRKELIALATQIDEARLAANAIDAAAPQRGVYGDLHHALLKTLNLIFPDEGTRGVTLADFAYECIMDGNTVEQAVDLADDKGLEALNPYYGEDD
jgi:hypothetical protein